MTDEINQNLPVSEESVDPRYKELENQYSGEVDITKSNFAFRGFGRSTDQLKAVDTAGVEYQRRVANLANIIDTEKLIAKGGDPKLIAAYYLSLAALRKEAQKLADEAATRRGNLLEEAVRNDVAARQDLYQRLPNNQGARPVANIRGVKVVIPKLQSSTRAASPNRVFVPMKSTQSILAPRARATFVKPLIPIRKVTTI